MSTVISKMNLEKYDAAMSEERNKLLAGAAKHLGYKVAQSDSLLNQLLKLGIVPFKTNEVEAYKQSKEKVGMYSGTKKWMMWGFGILSILAINIYSSLHFVQWGPLPTVAQVATLVTYVAVVIATIIWLVHGSEMRGFGTQVVHRWRAQWINQYEGMIPDHVLNTALTIRNAIPGTAFSIDALEKTTYSRMKPEPLPDPFLKVLLLDESESYYIEQWEEEELPRIS